MMIIPTKTIFNEQLNFSAIYLQRLQVTGNFAFN